MQKETDFRRDKTMSHELQRRLSEPIKTRDRKESERYQWYKEGDECPEYTDLREQKTS